MSKKVTTIKTDITVKLRERIKELEAELKEANSNAGYYKGRYEESNKKKEQEDFNIREEKHYLRTMQQSVEQEVRYLRDLVMHLTLTPDKIEAMKKKINEIDPNTGMVRNY